MTLKKFIISDKLYEGMRLDKFIIDRISIPFRLAQGQIRKKNIRVNNSKSSSNYKLQMSDVVSVHRNFEDAPIKRKQIDIPKKLKKKLHDSILYQSDDFIILNKWSGIACQRGNNVSISIDDLIRVLQNDNVEPKLVHRLDKETSGLLIIALNKSTARYFQNEFKSLKIEKTYSAIVENEPKYLKGSFENSINDNGKKLKAITSYKVKRKLKSDLFLLELKPTYGRKHQIRLHCAKNNCPILGDKKYNVNSVYKKKVKNLYLHAKKLKFVSPIGKTINIKVNEPVYFKDYL